MRAALALDQGGHASRACLIGEGGTILAEHSVPIQTRRGPAGEIEHDALELAESLRSAAAQVLRESTGRGLEIARAGLAVQRSTVVCFERDSAAPLSPAISWQDRRNAAWLETQAAHAPRVRELTGLPLSAHYGASKLRWCLEQLPSVQRARERGNLVLSPLAAWLVRQLTGGEALADPATASRTLLWDSAQRDWSAELLGLFGIERAWLPRCAPTRAAFGNVHLGAPLPALALSAVTGDQSAMPFAAGTPDLEAVYVNLGTGAFIQRPLAHRPADPAPLLGSVLAADADAALYSLEGTVNGAGAAASQFAASVARPESELWQALERLDDTVSLPVFVNGIGGLGSPFWRAQQPTYFIGEGTLIQRFAAVIESIVLLIAFNFERLCALGGTPARVIVGGGLARSDWLCRRLAAALELPVQRAALEATALGVAVLADPDLGAAAPAAAASFQPAQLPPPARAALSERRARLAAALQP